MHGDDPENTDEDKVVGAYVCGQGGEHEGWGGPPHIRQEQMLALPEWYKHTDSSWLVYTLTHRWAIVLIIASELWRWLVMLWHSWRWRCANEQLPFIFISLVMVARKVHDIVKTCGCKEQIFFSLDITYLAVRLTAKNGKARNIEGTVSSTAVYPPKPIFICSFW